MPKGSSGKYYQNNENTLQKKDCCGRYQSVSKEENKATVWL